MNPMKAYSTLDGQCHLCLSGVITAQLGSSAMTTPLYPLGIHLFYFPAALAGQYLIIGSNGSNSGKPK